MGTEKGQGQGEKEFSQFRGLTIWAAMTSSSTTAKTRREAFSKGEGATRGCSLARFGLLAPHNARARGWRHRCGRPGGLEDERSRGRSPKPIVSSVVSPVRPQGSPFPGFKTGWWGVLSPGVPGQVHGGSGGSGESLGDPRLQPGEGGGSRGLGSEGQPFPWGSALHGPPAAPGSSQAGDLGRERAPPVGPPEQCLPTAAAAAEISDRSRPAWQ